MQPVVLTYYTGGSYIHPKLLYWSSLVEENRKIYCDKYQYFCMTPKMCCFDHTSSKNCSWSHLKAVSSIWFKLILILDLFRRNVTDTILWLDADSLIIDMRVSIHDLLRLDSSRPFVASAEFGSDALRINTGIFVVKNNPNILWWFGEALKLSLLDTQNKRDEQSVLNNIYLNNITIQSLVHKHTPHEDLQVFTSLGEHPKTGTFAIHGAKGDNRRFHLISQYYDTMAAIDPLFLPRHLPLNAAVKAADNKYLKCENETSVYFIKRGVRRRIQNVTVLFQRVGLNMRHVYEIRSPCSTLFHLEEGHVII